MRDYLLQLTAKAWIALAFGVVILGWAGYTQWKAGGSVHGAAESDLVARRGTVVGGTEVTETTQRRRGGRSIRRYFELEAKLADGSTEKWRADIAVGRNRLEPLIDEAVEVKVDAGESNLLYEIRQNGQVILSYADAQKIMAANDQVQASQASDKGTLIVGSIALLLGIAGMLLRRKLVGGGERTAATPVIGEKV